MPRSGSQPTCSPSCYVFFTGTGNRHKRFSVIWWWHGFIRLLSHPYCHACIGDPEWDYVLSPHPDGHKRWSLNQFVRVYPDLYCGFEIPLLLAPDLQRVPDAGYHWMDSLCRWLTWGIFNPPDCIGVVLSVLDRCGLEVPDQTSPRTLHDWLLKQGYKHVTFDELRDGGDSHTSGCRSRCDASDRPIP